MKKLAIILALLLVPMAAFGMDTISDSDLDAVTGQAGVSIALTSIQIQTSGGTTSYGDADSSKWVSIVGLKTSTRTIGFHAKFDNIAVGSGAQTCMNFDALTIDIVDLTNVEGYNIHSMVVASDLPPSSSAGIKITLPDIIQIEQQQDQIRVIYMADGYDPGSAAVNADELIRIYNTAGTTRIIAADMGANWAAMAAFQAAPITSPTYKYFSGENTTIMISAH
jgi:hypothetical protein